ncbi:hypothetical protein EIP91_003376 [Steccherinum ochraceum]|uniref:DEAD/DEAH box helicase domain-containing protein n=1 Tax=Steccherinum ochraceum TaxID=92696 RepID=A0A4R0RE24_9APHY|nr:hypothetical protein EIP91_003376 [Steccherinum ochraceum]
MHLPNVPLEPALPVPVPIAIAVIEDREPSVDAEIACTPGGTEWQGFVGRAAEELEDVYAGEDRQIYQHNALNISEFARQTGAYTHIPLRHTATFPAVDGAEALKSNRFRSTDSQKLLTSIHGLYLPYEPHGHQLEGVGTTRENQDLLAILPTGAGKTELLTVHMIAMHALSEELTFCDSPVKGIPKDAMI